MQKDASNTGNISSSSAAAASSTTSAPQKPMMMMKMGFRKKISVDESGKQLLDAFTKYVIDCKRSFFVCFD